MGYRSEVKICVKKKDYIRMKDQLHTFSPEDYDVNMLDIENLPVFKEIPRSIGNDDTVEDVVVFGWNWIKWYYSPEIEFIENFLNGLDDYQFIRYGEDWEDIEERSNYDKGYCERLYFTRSIEIDM